MLYGTVVGTRWYPDFCRVVLEDKEGRESVVELLGMPPRAIALGDTIWTQCGKAMWNSKQYPDRIKDVQFQIVRRDFNGMIKKEKI